MANFEGLYHLVGTESYYMLEENVVWFAEGTEDDERGVIHGYTDSAHFKEHLRLRKMHLSLCYNQSMIKPKSICSQCDDNVYWVDDYLCKACRDGLR